MDWLLQSCLSPNVVFNPEEGQNFLKKHYEAGEAKCTCHGERERERESESEKTNLISLLFKYPEISGIRHVGGPVDAG